MSAPPTNHPNGIADSQNPPPPRRQKKRAANPLVARSKKPPLKLGQGSTSAARPPRAPIENGVKPTYNGWSEPPPAGYNDIPIKTTKKALLAGVRFHLMKFHQAKVEDTPVDPTDQDEFTRPVTLHRRDARQPPPGRVVKEEEPEAAQPNEAEAERQAQLRAERETQKAEDQAKIAPLAKDNAPKKPKKQKEERTIFSKAPKTQAAKKESDIRYEEALPWHLEDADGKNVWVGGYEAALSESNVAFVIDGSVFRMVPVEKWYRFTSKSRFQAYSIEEAEAILAKKFKPGRWVMKGEKEQDAARELEDTRRMLYGKGSMIKTESATFKAASRQEKMEHDDIDFDDDMFQDDDETMQVEKQEDEDTKESNGRIRREQLGANTFGDGDEQEVDKELMEQLKEEQQRQKYGKSTKKALIKRDREDIYASDNSDEKPWSSSSSDSSSDEDESSKDNEKKDPESKDGQADKDKAKSLTKSNTTPQGKQRLGDAIRNKKSLKRAGSPNLSESSGNESSRKKKMKKSVDPSGIRAGTPLGSAAIARRSKAGAGSGSDGEATGGEMSDGTGSRLKEKSRMSSRAGSPNAMPGGASPSSPGGATIEAWEILEQIPADGITIGDLIQPFSGRVGDRPGQMPRTEWIKMVRGLCNYGPDKKLTRK